VAHGEPVPEETRSLQGRVTVPVSIPACAAQMPRLPAITAKQAVRALKRAGFFEDRQRGSDLILIHPTTRSNCGADARVSNFDGIAAASDS